MLDGVCPCLLPGDEEVVHDLHSLDGVEVVLLADSCTKFCAEEKDHLKLHREDTGGADHTVPSDAEDLKLLLFCYQTLAVTKVCVTSYGPVTKCNI